MGRLSSRLTFKTLEEATQSSRIPLTTGLSASVWSRDVDTAIGVGRGIRAGDDLGKHHFMDGTPELPFGGYRQSGIGRELGRNAVKDYTEEKTLSRPHRTSHELVGEPAKKGVTI